MPVNMTAPRRLDGETLNLLRDIISEKHHRLGFTEPEFADLQERPFFVRAVEEKMIFVSESAQTVFVSVGIRKAGYTALGERPRFTLLDFLDSVKSRLSPSKA